MNKTLMGVTEPVSNSRGWDVRDRSGPGRNGAGWLCLASAAALPVGSGFTLLLLVSILALPLTIRTMGPRRELHVLLAASFVWSAAQLVSNLVNARDLVTSTVLLGPLVASAVVLAMHLAESGYSRRWVLSAIATGTVVYAIVGAGALQSPNPWKYGLAYGVIVLAALVVERGSRFLGFILLLVIAGVSYVADSRTITGFALIAAIVVLLVVRVNLSSKFVALFVLALVVSLYLIYPALALNGVLGARALEQQQRYESDGTNFVLSTRLEAPQMAILALNHPLIGIGSSGRVPAEEAWRALDTIDSRIASLRSIDVQYLLSTGSSTPGYRPHSALFASWLYAGALALPFWIAIVGVSARAALNAIRERSAVAGTGVLIAALLIWDAFFSPLSDFTAPLIAVYLCYLLLPNLSCGTKFRKMC